MLLVGLVTAAFLVFNRVIGTGSVHRSIFRVFGLKVLSRIFATPSVILRASGSVGMSLVMWVMGAAVAACGTAVYLELGTVRESLLDLEIVAHVHPRVSHIVAEKRYTWSISSDAQSF